MIAFSVVAILNISTLIFGLYTLSKHYKGLHILFQVFLFVSILCEAYVAWIKPSNLIILVPRLFLFIYVTFVMNSLLPRALEINVDGDSNGSEK